MNLFCFGLGYCADYLSTKFIKQGWQVSATCRSSEKAAVLDASDIRPVLLPGRKVTVTDLGKADHILISVPPEQDGSDPVLNFAGAALAALQDQIKWVGYLSTTGVYGDHQGACERSKAHNISSHCTEQQETNNPSNSAYIACLFPMHH
ncbi:MAG: hypothetical protein VX978_06995, partial [Pseudomonadota bacterium]|nr:hypothetical protein [Pseudomonadota bacterium]